MSVQEVPLGVIDMPAPASLEHVEVRELPQEEWESLRAFPPFSEGIPLPSEHAKVVVGRTPSGEVVAFWWVFPTVHVEPLWIHEDYRRRPGMIRRLWQTVQDILTESKVKVAFAILGHAEAALSLPPALRLGFSRVPGDLYFIRVPDFEELQRKVDEAKTGEPL